MLLDTQIISRHWRKRASTTNGAVICSVVANEFFEVYSKSSTRKNNYYIPMYNPRHVEMLNVRWGGKLAREHAPSHHSTDKLLLDFRNTFPSVVEYGSHAVSRVINDKTENVFEWAISKVEKGKRRALLDRFRFLVASDISCIPLMPASADIALDLLERFVLKHSLKGHFRNSLNDLLILAVAIHNRMPLNTEDSLLSRFAAAVNGGMIVESNGDLIVDFERKPATSGARMRESKGYINRGWRIVAQNVS